MKSNKNKVFAVLGIIVLYLFSAGTSYGIFNYLKTPVTINTNEEKQKADQSGFNSESTEPKTEECPLNGQLRTKNEKALWEKRRPLGVMVENHEESRPQSGITNADVVYEAVAEGGITRFLLVYYCKDSEMVGPVRSARTYFIDFLSEYGDNPLYAHVGGANTPGPANALGQIEDYGWALKNDLNQFSIGFPTYWRDYERLGREVATEHTVYSVTEKLWQIGAKRGLTAVDENDIKWSEKFIPYSFKEDLVLSKRPASFSVSFIFWPGYDAYSVKWVYDPKTNLYSRFNGGLPHLDNNNKKQLTAKNIVLLYMTEENANDGYENNAHLLYGTIGTGKAVVIQDGIKIEGEWQKEDRESKLQLTAVNDDEIKLNRGKIWFEVLPVGTKVTY